MLALSGTHAYIIVPLRDISPDEEITISYTKNGYYHGGEDCQCATCTGVPPRTFSRFRPDYSASTSAGPSRVAEGSGEAPKRKTRRAGRRRTRQKAARKEALEKEGGQGGSADNHD